MEPTVLLIGRSLDTLRILKDELIKFERIISVANSEELIESTLKNEKIDLIVVGAGLPKETSDSMVNLIEKIAPEIEYHIMEKTPGMTPVSMISYTNEKAIMWKLMASVKSK